MVNNRINISWLSRQFHSNPKLVKELETIAASMLTQRSIHSSDKDEPYPDNHVYATFEVNSEEKKRTFALTPNLVKTLFPQLAKNDILSQAQALSKKYPEHSLNNIILEVAGYEGDIPHEYLGSISRIIMTKPVHTLDCPNYKFDEKMILQALEYDQRHPVTRKPLKKEDLIHDETLRQKIEAFIQKFMLNITPSRNLNNKCKPPTRSPAAKHYSFYLDAFAPAPKEMTVSTFSCAMFSQSSPTSPEQHSSLPRPPKIRRV